MSRRRRDPTLLGGLMLIVVLAGVIVILRSNPGIISETLEPVTDWFTGRVQDDLRDVGTTTTTP